MKTSASQEITNLVKAERAALEALIGANYSVLENDGICRIVAPHLEFEFGYDWRDRWVTASLRPLQTSQKFDRPYGTSEWLRFLDQVEPPCRKSDIDRQQILDAIERMKPIIELWQDDLATRDAFWFMHGYLIAYNDWASRQGTWSEMSVAS